MLLLTIIQRLSGHIGDCYANTWLNATLDNNTTFERPHRRLLRKRLARMRHLKVYTCATSPPGTQALETIALLNGIRLRQISWIDRHRHDIKRTKCRLHVPVAGARRLDVLPLGVIEMTVVVSPPSPPPTLELFTTCHHLPWSSYEVQTTLRPRNDSPNLSEYHGEQTRAKIALFHLQVSKH